jgi:hypothetical protein
MGMGRQPSIKNRYYGGWLTPSAFPCGQRGILGATHNNKNKIQLFSRAKSAPGKRRNDKLRPFKNQKWNKVCQSQKQTAGPKWAQPSMNRPIF